MQGEADEGVPEAVRKVRGWPDGQNLQSLFFSLYGQLSPRKQRLVAVAMCHRVAGVFPDHGCTVALDVAERYADGEAKRADLSSVHEAVRVVRIGIDGLYTRAEAQRHALGALLALTHPTKRNYADKVADACAAAAAYLEQSRYFKVHDRECAAQKVLLLDVLCPTGSVDVRRYAEHANRLAARLALDVYRDRAFDRLPILADALEDAGCTNSEVLGHLRGPGPHVRGCWAVDLVLGRG
jgi:hypothetical protein